MKLINKSVYLCLFVVLSSYDVKATIEILNPLGTKVDSFRDREAPFEDDIPVMEGFIVLADPADACTPIEEPTFLTNFTFYKFVLINGSDQCGFKRKISNAERAGYDFAVIFDPTAAPVEYFHFGFDVNIPVVLISFEDGIIIKNNYLYNNSHVYNYRIRIKPNIPDFTYYMYLFGAVIGVCFFVMLLFMMCLLIKCIQERRKSRRNRLSSRQIKQIPTVKFAKGDQYDVCAICLEDYNEGDKLRLLPCSHAYHAKCIDPWLMNNRRNCPLCKRKITFGDSADESDSEDSELTSPAENTPLLASPSNHGQTWGTFVNPVQTMNDGDRGGPSSLPDGFFSNVNIIRSYSTAAENPFVSDSESENLLPPAHLSVNNGRDGKLTNQVTVQVVTPNEAETSTNSAAII